MAWKSKIKDLKNGNHFQIGDILRSKGGGFTFIVERFYRISIFDTIYCSGHGVGSNKPYDYKNIGIITGIKEEECELVKNLE